MYSTKKIKLTVMAIKFPPVYKNKPM